MFKRENTLPGGYALYELTDHLGNVRAVIMKSGGNVLSLTSKTDYYPFGMPMPNRHTTDNNYRYAFQGQEKDNETGMEAFELRLWDGRIGRWLTIDPYHEFFSPYVGMGNNPISLIDPDGGSTEGGGDNCVGCPHYADLDEVVVSAPARNYHSGSTGDYAMGFFDRLMGHDPDRPRGSQSYMLDTFRTHSADDFVTNFEQAFFGVDPYNTDNIAYNDGARLFDNTVLAAELAIPATAVYQGGKILLRRVTARVIKTIVRRTNVAKVNKLIQAANSPDKGGFTAVGRALQKHGSRSGSIFPRATGNPASINSQGEAILKGILTNKNVTIEIRHHARFGNVLEYKIPGGQGARFSGDGKTFIGFLE